MIALYSNREQPGTAKLLADTANREPMDVKSHATLEES
jgi:hypothetical protein